MSPAVGTERRRRRHAALAIAATAAVALASCGGTDEEPADAGTGPLAGVCPSPLVVQTAWNPYVGDGYLYQLLVGSDVDFEKDTLSARGRLWNGGEDTGVVLEIRAGGPGIDYMPVSRAMYEDPEILLGQVGTDEAILEADARPTVAVLAPLEKDPRMIMWDPATYDVDEIAELPDDAPVYFLGPSAAVAHLQHTGVVSATQLDWRQLSGPDQFVAFDGEVAQQGIATHDPYVFEELNVDWGQPVRYQLIHDTGWRPYAASLAVRPVDLAAESDCLEALVPILQSALVAYASHPSAANALITRAASTYDTGWWYPARLATWAAQQQVALGILGNGGDATIGDFEPERVEELIRAHQAATGEGVGTTVGDVVADDFIDPSIGLS